MKMLSSKILGYARVTYNIDHHTPSSDSKQTLIFKVPIPSILYTILLKMCYVFHIRLKHTECVNFISFFFVIQEIGQSGLAEVNTRQIHVQGFNVSSIC